MRRAMCKCDRCDNQIPALPIKNAKNKKDIEAFKNKTFSGADRKIYSDYSCQSARFQIFDNTDSVEKTRIVELCLECYEEFLNYMGSLGLDIGWLE